MNGFAKKLGATTASAALALGLCGALALTPGSTVPAAQAASPTYTAEDSSCVYVKLPSAWKSIITFCGTEGHGSGAYHTDFHAKVSNGQQAVSSDVFRIDGMDAGSNGTVSAGKTRAYGGKVVKSGYSKNTVTWKFKNASARNTASISVVNFYLCAWENAHSSYGKRYAGAWKRIVREVSHGKVSYRMIKRWGKSKATRKGNSATYAYVKKYIAPNVSLR